MFSKSQLIRSRGSLFLKGFASLVFGLVALAHPGDEIQQMMLPFGMLVFLNGIVNICQCFSLFNPHVSARRAVMTIGIIESFIGLSAILFLNVGTTFFLILISLWLVLTGLMQVANSEALKPVSGRYQAPKLSGWLETVFGILVLVNLVTQWFDPVYELSILAILSGCIMIYTYFKIQALRDYLRRRPKELTRFRSPFYYG